MMIAVGLKALLALLLSCRAAARGLRTKASFEDISSDLGSLSRFGGTNRDSKFWTVGGNGLHMSSVSFQLPSTLMPTTTTILTTTTPPPTTTTPPPTTTTMTTTIQTTSLNAAQAGLAAQVAAAATAAAGQQAAAAARAEEAQKAAKEAQEKAKEPAKAPEPAKTGEPRPEVTTPPPPPPQTYEGEMRGIISKAASAAASAIKEAVAQAFNSHGPPAMDAAVKHWKATAADTPPFCDELSTPAPPSSTAKINPTTTTTTTPRPTVEPPVYEETTQAPTTTTTKGSTTTTKTAEPTTTAFAYKLYGEHNAYCIMRATGVPTTTQVDLGSSGLEPVAVVDPNDFEFLRKKGIAPPSQPVHVLAVSPPEALQSEEQKTKPASTMKHKVEAEATKRYKAVQSEKEKQKQKVLNTTVEVAAKVVAKWENKKQQSKPLNATEQRVAADSASESKHEKQKSNSLNATMPKIEAGTVVKSEQNATDQKVVKTFSRLPTVYEALPKAQKLKDECPMRKAKCTEFCGGVVKHFDCEFSSKRGSIDKCSCGARPSKSEPVSKEEFVVKPQAVQSEKEKQKPEPLGAPKQSVDESSKVAQEAQATAMGEAAEDALKKLKLSSDAGSQTYLITGPPPGVDF